MSGRGPSPAAIAASQAAQQTPPHVGSVVPPARPKAPAGLDAAGRGLWKRLHDALPDDLRFSARELELLQRACQLADREAALKAVIKKDGLMTTGSMGQAVLHPAAMELRQVEQTLCGLLVKVSTEDTAGEVPTPRQERAVKAAKARWGAHNQAKARREAATGRG
jgi:P27 family predicted phage terminase small subunit